MNTPTHVACGACVAHAIAYASRNARGTPGKTGLVAAVIIAAAVLSHLALDLLPHSAWIVYLDWFKPFPYPWLIREAVFGFVVGLAALLLAGKAWPFVLLGMAAGMYPDVEKVLFVDHGVAEPLILFDWHSRHLSSRTGGLPKSFLVAMECCIIAALLFTMWRVRRRAPNYGVARCGASAPRASSPVGP